MVYVEWIVPMYLDLKVESISSAGMLRAEEVAVGLTSSGPRVRISMVSSEVEEVQLVAGTKSKGVRQTEVE